MSDLLNPPGSKCPEGMRPACPEGMRPACREVFVILTIPSEDLDHARMIAQQVVHAQLSNMVTDHDHRPISAKVTTITGGTYAIDYTARKT